ncbi:MAG: metallophosphoesterase, partial [Candidatus Hodarchaeota archaeon]
TTTPDFRGMKMSEKSSSLSIFVFSDVHLGLQKRKDHANLKEINSFVKWIASLNKKPYSLSLGPWGEERTKEVHSAEKLILLGDLLELRDATDNAIMTSSRIIDRILNDDLGEVEKIFIPGNHDCLITEERKLEWPIVALCDKVEDAYVVSPKEGHHYIFVHGHQFDRFHSRFLNPISRLLAVFREGGLAYGTYGKVLVGGAIAITLTLILGGLGRVWIEWIKPITDEQTDPPNPLTPFIELIQALRPGNPTINFIKVQMIDVLQVFHLIFPGYPMALMLTIWIWMVSLPILISLTSRFLWRVIEWPTKISDILRRCKNWWKRFGEPYKGAKKVTLIMGHYHMPTYLSSRSIKRVLGTAIDPTMDVDVVILPSWIYEDSRKEDLEPQNMGLLLDKDGITFLGWNDTLKKPFYIPLEFLERRRTTGEAVNAEIIDSLKSIGASEELLQKWKRPLAKDLIFKSS